ncbi:hypothetical protein SESBI_35225 [Sesbania bispinosa]|nr:hypothetical protein SESBI_35225 [Sesbania bispinosa]
MAAYSNTLCSRWRRQRAKEGNVRTKGLTRNKRRKTRRREDILLGTSLVNFSFFSSKSIIK